LLRTIEPGTTHKYTFPIAKEMEHTGITVIHLQNKSDITVHLMMNKETKTQHRKGVETVTNCSHIILNEWTVGS
jgi:hypothetical protein